MNKLKMHLFMEFIQNSINKRKKQPFKKQPFTEVLQNSLNILKGGVAHGSFLKLVLKLYKCIYITIIDENTREPKSI